MKRLLYGILISITLAITITAPCLATTVYWTGYYSPIDHGAYGARSYIYTPSYYLSLPPNNYSDQQPYPSVSSWVAVAQITQPSYPGFVETGWMYNYTTGYYYKSFTETQGYPGTFSQIQWDIQSTGTYKIYEVKRVGQGWYAYINGQFKAGLISGALQPAPALMYAYSEVQDPWLTPTTQMSNILALNQIMNSNGTWSNFPNHRNINFLPYQCTANSPTYFNTWGP